LEKETQQGHKMKLAINQETKRDYVEFSFHLPIADLFYEKWDEDPLKPDGKELNFICDLLRIKIEKEKIEEKFWGHENSVEVFHGAKNPETFIYFDLARDPQDQCMMIHLGVRCNRELDEKVRDKLLELYKKLTPRSNFEIDYFNQSLYAQAFNSDFHFYGLEKNTGRKLNHHHL
jgi:hypothetical protein